jgi:hypothetical protein
VGFVVGVVSVGDVGVVGWTERDGGQCSCGDVGSGRNVIGVRGFCFTEGL